MTRAGRRAAAGLALVVGSMLTGACSREVPATASRRPHVILVTVDTLRADHLGLAGYPRDTSPNVDALARQGAWFPRFYSQSATTGAAHASLFTSQPPADHGVTANNQRFPDAPSLMTALRGAGYRTAGFVSSIVLGRKSGLQEHFEVFDDELTTPEPNRGTRYERPAMETVAAALRLLDRTPRDRPIFLWVHLIDPHGPYQAPVDPDRYVGDALYGRIGRDLPVGATDWEIGRIPRYQALGDRTDADFYVARYDAEIHYADAALGVLFSGLRERDLDREALIVVTADHGETLAEPGHHRVFSHGAIAYEEVVHVPLIVREPHGERRLDVVARDRPISALDLAPTLLAMVGLPAPATFQGRDLLRTTLDPDAPVFSMGSYGTERLETRIGTQFSVLQGPFRLIVNSKDGSEEIYDHRRDPSEATNLIAQEPKRAAELRSALATQTERRRIARPAPVDAERAAGLKALGYVE